MAEIIAPWPPGPSRFVTGQQELGVCDQFLLCCPHAGAGATSFAGWRRWLPPGTGLLAVQLPGREDRIHETSPADLGQAALQVARALGPVAQRPLVLFGHSMGAHLAVEVARLLERAGDVLRGVITSGSAPTSAEITRQPIAGLPEQEFLDRLAEYGGIPGELLSHPELRAEFLPVLRRDVAMSEKWRDRAGPPLRCALVAIGGSADQRVPAHALGLWRGYTAGPFRCQLFTGGHFFIRDHVREVMQIVESLMPARPR